MKLTEILNLPNLNEIYFRRKIHKGERVMYMNDNIICFVDYRSDFCIYRMVKYTEHLKASFFRDSLLADDWVVDTKFHVRVKEAVKAVEKIYAENKAINERRIAEKKLEETSNIRFLKFRG